MQTSQRARLYRNPAYEVGFAATSLNEQFRIITSRSVGVTFENNMYRDATGTAVYNRRLTGSYCTLIHMVLNYSLSTV